VFAGKGIFRIDKVLGKRGRKDWTFFEHGVLLFLMLLRGRPGIRARTQASIALRKDF